MSVSLNKSITDECPAINLKTLPHEDKKTYYDTQSKDVYVLIVFFRSICENRISALMIFNKY